VPGSFDAGGLSSVEISALVKDLAKTDMVMRKALPKRLREAAKPVADQAKANAAAISPRIKIGTRVKLNGRAGASVKVIGRSPSNPPLAGLLERGNKGARSTSSFRHPVYGNTSTWVVQPTQPYLQPALEAKANEATAKAAEVITDVLVALNFK
jgi:hypothetical protein